MDEPVIGLALWASDVDGLASFLVRAAGLELRERHPGYAALGAGDDVIAIHADEDYRGHPWFQALGQEGVTRGLGTEIRVRVEDAAASYREALAAGGISVQPPGPVSDTVVESHVMGPEGYLFILWQRL